MCGIAGAVHRRDAARPEDLDRQLAAVAHRGPDSSGGFVVGRGAVGQNRLAIIDLRTGDPPVRSEDGRIGAVMNGEIYNFRELRAGLEAAGHVLATQGDTEVVAHLAEDLPPVEVARRLDGMFTFASWDAVAERLVIARDRLGKKPLYYWQGPDALVFGSEIKAVLAHPAVPRSLDASVLPDYLRFGYVPSPRTFYEGIRSVPPGHVLVVERDFEVRLERYWAPVLPSKDDRLDVSLAEAATLVGDCLEGAVRRRLVSDVPLGAFLSGGIDSSAVVAYMARHAEGRVRTFTIGFEDDEGYDERGFARQVSEHLGTDHTEFVVTPQAVDLIEDLVRHHDQPFGDSSAVPTWFLSQLTREHVTVALCGDGGDELFAGYERFAAGVAATRLGALPGPVLAAVRAGARALPDRGRLRSVRRFADVAAQPMPDPFLHWISYVPDDLAARLVPGGATPGVDEYRAHWASTAGAPPLERLLLLNLETYLLDDLLPKVDRVAMAHALEVRAPFLDDALLDLAMRLPPGLKQRGLSLKRVLKASMRGVLPDEILDRPKRGFGVPLDRWFRGDLGSFLDDRLGPSARIRAYLQGDVLDEVLAEHRSGARSHGHTLWALLTLEVFLRMEGW